MLENTEYLRERSKINGDPVADALTFANARLTRPGTLIAGGSWSLQFPPPQKLKFNAVLKGNCWLIMENEIVPRPIAAGDVFILPSDQSYVLTGDLSAAPVDALPLFDAATENRVQVGKGSDLFIIGGHIELDASHGWSLAEILPPLLHINADSPESVAVRWLLDQLIEESTADRPGAMLASGHLVQLLFVQTLRFYLTTDKVIPVGWFGALADEQIAPALRLIHREPEHNWTLNALAKQIGMSRTAFAVKFKKAVGVAPLKYLRNFRMHIAERELREGTQTISALGLSLGYQSESAFSHAFKKHTALAPHRYRLLFAGEHKSRALLKME